jgi:hypothetical protein
MLIIEAWHDRMAPGEATMADGFWQRMRSWVSSWWEDSDSDDWGQESLDEARNLLATTWANVSARPPAAPTTAPSLPPESIAEIGSILKDQKSDWAALNRAEQLIVSCMDGDLIDETIARKLFEARQRKVPGAVEHATRYAQLVTAGITPDRKRAFLYGIVTDIQHFGLRGVQVRRFRAGAVGYVARWMGVALVVVLVPFFVFILHSYFPGWTLTHKFDRIVVTFPNYGLYTAVSFGLLGALFSRFIEFQKTYVSVPLDDAEAYYSRGNIVLHVLIGTVGAMIIYFFTASGLLSGNLVPDVRKLTFVAASSDDAVGPLCDLSMDPSGCAATAAAIAGPTGKPAEIVKPPDAIGPTQTAASPGASASDGAKPPNGITTVLGLRTRAALVPSRDLALLIIWALIAGFSERLVPNLLNSAESRIEATQTPTAKPPVQ